MNDEPGARHGAIDRIWIPQVSNDNVHVWLDRLWSAANKNAKAPIVSNQPPNHSGSESTRRPGDQDRKTIAPLWLTWSHA
jgi:hypothetical protein